MSTTDPKKYFIKISPEFLFDTYGVFKSEYAPWVYLILKFKYNFYIEKAPNKRFGIPFSNISQLFEVNPSTVTRAVQELVQHGFLSKHKNLYKINDESFYKDKYKSELLVDGVVENAEQKRYPKFIKANQEQFQTMLIKFKEMAPDKYKSKKFIIKTLETNYYLIAKNGHCLLKKKMVGSFECPNTIRKALNYDNRTVTDILNLLESAGYVKLGPDIKITTINVNYEDTTENNYKETTYINKNVVYDKMEPFVNYPMAEKDINKTDAIKEEEFYYKDRNEYDPINGGFKTIKVKVLGKEPIIEKIVERVLSEEELKKGKALIEKFKRERAEQEERRLKPLQDEIDQYKLDHPGEPIVECNVPKLTKIKWDLFEDEGYENTKDEDLEETYSEEDLQLEECA